MEQTQYSNIKIFRHPDKLGTIKCGQISAPISVRIKPINACNHRCYYCSYPNIDPKFAIRNEEEDIIFKRNVVNKADMIPKDIMIELISDLSEMGVKAVTLSGGGEPLIYPYIKETLELLNARDIATSVITNGQDLKGETARLLYNARWVRISMDSPRRKEYARIRQIKEEWFDEVALNIANFAVNKNKDCELGINFVITKDNYQDIYEMALFVKSLGVNHIKFAGLCCKDFAAYHAPLKEEAIKQIRMAAELENETFKVINKYEGDFVPNTSSRKYNRCYIMQTVPVIAADCKVYFCHDKAYDPKGVLGDLRKRSFESIWFSKEAKEIFDKFDPSKDKGCNTHCTYEDRNLLIDRYLKLDENHIDFI